MNKVRSLVQAAHTSPDPGASLYSTQMLCELLALNEEMVAQLRLERLGVAGNAEFITSMIEQHERAAATLRAQLASHEANPKRDREMVFKDAAASTDPKSGGNRRTVIGSRQDSTADATTQKNLAKRSAT